MLDVVMTANDATLDEVKVVESGLSDHGLVLWTIPGAARLSCTKLLRRTWKDFSLEKFIERVELSPLCKPVDPRKSATELAF